MTDPLTLISTRTTPQSEPDPAVADRQKRNAAGGYAFKISDEARIHRFLTLGTTGGTYYTGERELTKANADVVLAAARERGEWLAEQAREISVAGRAPKQNPAIFALAAVAGLGDEEARKLALSYLPQVCRTGTTLFTFARYVRQFRGWGPGLVKAVGRWYLAPEVDQLAYQAVKYRSRS
jgi:60 kDa SS-A/Ro ribonucleoprotein